MLPLLTGLCTEQPQQKNKYMKTIIAPTKKGASISHTLFQKLSNFFIIVNLIVNIRGYIVVSLSQQEQHILQPLHQQPSQINNPL